MNKEQIESEREMVCHMAARILAGLYAGSYVDDEGKAPFQKSRRDAVIVATRLAHGVVDEVSVPGSRRV